MWKFQYWICRLNYHSLSWISQYPYIETETGSEHAIKHFRYIFLILHSLYEWWNHSKVQGKSFTAQKMKFSIKDSCSKCDKIRSFLRIWSHLQEKSLTENLIFVQWLDILSNVRCWYSSLSITSNIGNFFFFSFLVDITHQTDMVFYMCDCTFKHAKHAFKTI